MDYVYRYCYFGAYYFSSATPAAVAAPISGTTSAAAAPTSAMSAAAAALGKLRRYQYERRMSTICLFGSFLRPSWRGFVLILDVQFHEYLSITIFTLISFWIKIYSSSFSFILLGFRELPMVSLILHIAPLLASLDSSLDSFCSRLACEYYVFI